MRANLSKREPEFYKKWSEGEFYRKVLEKNKDKPLYVLHDGPPYANGKIHLGTALNKILKDFIVKQKNMSGFKAAFVPGWDTHGLPIELKALKAKNVDNRNLSPVELRKVCREYASHYVDVQREQFESLGVIGDFKNPYLTFSRNFEARQIEVFAKMTRNGQIYRGLKPVYYCCKCLTALAESEIEYFNDECDSIYVKFKVSDDGGFFAGRNFDKNKISFIIWTTTTWTLPANVAICLSPRFEYCLVEVADEFFVVAKNLVESTMQAANIDDYRIVDSFSGSLLENFTTIHPFLNRKSKIILGNHVTLESGTGCVHTAPGHGVEDFEICRKYDDLPIVVVVDEHGKLTEEAGEFAGLDLNEANKKILEVLRKNSSLFASLKIEHSYPHCWRCKEPVLFRATKQWFCSIKGFKGAAIDSLKGVEWIPSWGETRMENMIADRSDWCISRQRVWGVPIPAFYCEDCGECVLNEELVLNVARVFEQLGSDSWFEKDADYFTKGFRCEKCGSSRFRKETDIMDVWFDSGCSHAAVLNSSSDLHWPADLYLEGADQYRGWFQSSLITAVATKKSPPYKAVCTHGWVVDGNGRKMSKSLANGVAPDKIVSSYGAEILRLWVASADYHSDIRISDEILKQLTETYRKIRNTARFMLANVGDFNVKTDFVGLDELFEIDRLVLHKLNDIIKTCRKAYEKFEFFTIYRAVYGFCVVDLSNFYLDIVKDRLYCDAKKSLSRRAVQTALFLILDSLIKIIAPIVSFTAEEVWSLMPHRDEDDCDSVFFNEMNHEIELKLDEDFLRRWSAIEKVADAVKKVLEIERENKKIGSSLESKLIIFCESDEAHDLISAFSVVDLKALFLVSGVEIRKQAGGEHNFKNLGISLSVQQPDGNKCERCWGYDESVGKNSKYETLCERCAEVVEKFEI